METPVGWEKRGIHVCEYFMEGGATVCQSRGRGQAQGLALNTSCFTLKQFVCIICVRGVPADFHLKSRAVGIEITDRLASLSVST